MDEKIITTNELEVLANEFYGSKITQEEYFSRLDDIDCYIWISKIYLTQ